MEPSGAGCSVDRTNSGESICLVTCSRKAAFHGAGPLVAAPAVLDILRRMLLRRKTALEAMIAMVEAITAYAMFSRSQISR